MEHHVSHRTDVREILYFWDFFRKICRRNSSAINLLAPELFFYILAHPVYKMFIKQEPNTLQLWNKLHFEEKNGEYIPRLKYSVPVFVE